MVEQTFRICDVAEFENRQPVTASESCKYLMPQNPALIAAIPNLAEVYVYGFIGNPYLSTS
jgi:hypothetical protein